MLLKLSKSAGTLTKESSALVVKGLRTALGGKKRVAAATVGGFGAHGFSKGVKAQHPGAISPFTKARR